MRLPVYKQTTYETCLACNLLINANRVKPIKITKNLELQILNHSLDFSKENFTIGHLDYVAKRLGLKIDWFVDNRHFYNLIKKLKMHKNIHVKPRKIDLKFLDTLLKTFPVILYLDSYSLFKVYHYPHFVTILEKKNNKYKISDTWYGKRKVIDSKVISEGIILLRNHLKFSPQLIQIT